MLKFLDDLDKKNTRLSNLAILPGFNFEDLNKSTKRQSNYNESNYNLDSIKDKKVIDDTTFTKLYASIDSPLKRQTKKPRSRDKKKTRKA